MSTFIKPLAIGLLLLCFSTLPSCGSVPINGIAIDVNSSESQEAFAFLKSLVGTWERSGDADDGFRIVFSLTAGETVLVESWMRNGAVHSLTVYHLDGSNLLATHYCPQGNQPRLRFSGGVAKGVVSFDFQDATNLLGPSHSRQTSVSFEISDSGMSLTRREAYSSDESVDESGLELVRSNEK